MISISSSCFSLSLVCPSVELPLLSILFIIFIIIDLHTAGDFDDKVKVPLLAIQLGYDLGLVNRR